MATDILIEELKKENENLRERLSKLENLSYFKKSDNKIITISTTGKAILIKFDFNNTIKDHLKALGGSWNKTLGGWVFPRTRQEEIVDIMNDSQNIYRSYTVEVQ